MKYTDMDADELEVEFNTDHTGKIVAAENGTTTFEWSYDDTSDKGDVVYKAGDVTVAIIGYRSNLSEYAGDLMMTSDSNAVFILERKGTNASVKATGATKPTSSVQKSETSLTMTSSQKNAVKKAESYLKYSAFSYTGLIEQLEYEGYSNDDATYAALNCGADWKEQAVKKAEEYLKYSAFSKSGLIEQLEYEGFTHEQAVYGADQAY